MARGGSRPGSGRKSKAEELGLPALIDEVIGEDGKRTVVQKLYEKAKSGSYLHQQLLMAYMYGKPKESVAIQQDTVIRWIEEDGNTNTETA
jgi:hypothetical protein